MATPDELLQSDPSYQENLGLLEQEEQLGRSTLERERGSTTSQFARSREDIVRSYQDTLDEIRRQRQAVGLQFRGTAAQRQLYDPSGELSGIGQNVAAQAIEPLEARTARFGERHARDLSDLTAREQEALGGLAGREAGLGLEFQRQRLALRDKYGNIIQESINAPREALLKERREQQSRGREYLSTPAAATRARQQGRTVIKIGGDLFALGPIEEVQQKQRVKTLNKTTGPGRLTSPSLQRSPVYDRTGKQIGFGLYNPKTGQTTYQNLAGNQSINIPEGARVGTAPPRSIDPQVRVDLQDDISAGLTLGDLYKLYPELDPSEIQEMYENQ